MPATTTAPMSSTTTTPAPTTTYRRIYRAVDGRLYEAPACRRCKGELGVVDVELHPACRPCDGCLADAGQPCDPFCLSHTDQH